MRLIFTILLLSTSFSAISQEFSVGARTGIGYNSFFRNDIELKPDQTWDKQLFVRYQSKKRFVAELGFEHYRHRDDIYVQHNWEHSGRVVISGKSRSDYFSIPMLFLYNINLAANDIGHFQHQVGLQFCPSFLRTTQHIVIYHEKDDRWSQDAWDERTFTIMCGPAYTVVYKIAERMALSTLLAYRLDLAAKLGGLSPTSRDLDNHLALQIGFSYVF